MNAKPKFRTQYDYELNALYLDPEVNDLPSLTEPDMSLTPRQILDRFATGRPVPQSTDMHYTGEDYLPDIDSLDLVEIDELMNENQQHIAELQDEIAQAKKRKAALLDSPDKKTVDESKTDDVPPA